MDAYPVSPSLQASFNMDMNAQQKVDPTVLDLRKIQRAYKKLKVSNFSKRQPVWTEPGIVQSIQEISQAMYNKRKSCSI